MQQQIVEAPRCPVRRYSWADMPPNPAWAMPKMGARFQAGTGGGGFLAGNDPLDPHELFGAQLVEDFDADNSVSDSLLYTGQTAIGAPAVTLTKDDSTPIRLKQRFQLDMNTASGLGGTADWYFGASSNTTITTAPTVPLGGVMTGYTLHFPAGAYSTNFHYTNAVTSIVGNVSRTASALSYSAAAQQIAGPNGHAALSVIGTTTRFDWTYARGNVGTTHWNVWGIMKLVSWTSPKYFLGDDRLLICHTRTTNNLCNSGNVEGSVSGGAAALNFIRFWSSFTNSSGATINNDGIKLGSAARVANYNCGLGAGNVATGSNHFIFPGSVGNMNAYWVRSLYVEGAITQTQVDGMDAYFSQRYGASVI